MLDFFRTHLGWCTASVIAVVIVVVVRIYRRQSRRLSARTKELEHLSAELIRVNRIKSEFLANVSHELRTPLNAIVGFTDLLREGVYGDLTPRQAGPVQRIEVSANHLRHLVDQILDLAKIAAGRLEVHPELVDTRPFILDVVSETEPLIAGKPVHLSLALSAALPRVYTDPTHLRQIVLNLVANAVKYTNEGTIIVRNRVVERTDPILPARLRAPTGFNEQAPSSWIAIQVIDTGIGIASADHDRIFEEFEQIGAGPRGDSVHRGTGLGLPISRRLAHLLGGDVTLESELGKGSIFTLWLPLYGGTGKATPTAMAPPVTSA